MLVTHDVAVYSAHLPLDVHPELGNNALLAAHLGLEPSGGFAKYQSIDVGLSGSSDVPTRLLAERAAALAVAVRRPPGRHAVRRRSHDATLGHLHRRRRRFGNTSRSRATRTRHADRRRGTASHRRRGARARHRQFCTPVTMPRRRSACARSANDSATRVRHDVDVRRRADGSVTSPARSGRHRSCWRSPTSRSVSGRRRRRRRVVRRSRAERCTRSSGKTAQERRR